MRGGVGVGDVEKQRVETHHRSLVDVAFALDPHDDGLAWQVQDARLVAAIEAEDGHALVPRQEPRAYEPGGGAVVISEVVVCRPIRPDVRLPVLVVRPAERLPS